MRAGKLSFRHHKRLLWPSVLNVDRRSTVGILTVSEMVVKNSFVYFAQKQLRKVYAVC